MNHLVSDYIVRVIIISFDVQANFSDRYKNFFEGQLLDNMKLITPQVIKAVYVPITTNQICTQKGHNLLVNCKKAGAVRLPQYLPMQAGQYEVCCIFLANVYFLGLLEYYFCTQFFRRMCKYNILLFLDWLQLVTSNRMNLQNIFSLSNFFITLSNPDKHF